MSKNAFVIMPFSESFIDVYEYLIFEALHAEGYVVRRADDIKSQNNILGDIVEGIISSDLIVADLTDSNPNVYYELGIAHAMNKRVILITQSIEDLPFDLRSYRVVAYSTHFAKMNQAKKALQQLIMESFNNQLPFGNPVKDFGSLTLRNNTLPISFGNPLNEQGVDKLGLLDYRIKFEEGFEELALVVQDVGEGLVKINPEVLIASDQISSGKHNARELQKIAIKLSNCFKDYGAYIRPKNEKYKILLKDIESSLEYFITQRFEGNQGVEEEFMELIAGLDRVEKSAFDGRQGFVNLVEEMDAIPQIEQNFDREKIFMSTELKEFISNIDQTVAVLSRASRLGKRMIEKYKEEIVVGKIKTKT